MNQNLTVAREILNQIVAGIGKSAFWSWGASNFAAIKDDEGQPGLAFCVNGRLFNGVVAVYLNWDDTYIIKSYNPEEGYKTICSMAFCDNVGEIIDRHIEVGDDWDDYMKFCENERKELLRMMN